MACLVTFRRVSCHVVCFMLFLQGQWERQFDKENVFKAEFFVTESHSCPVSMMYQEHKFYYRMFSEDKVQVLSLPYKGGEISMVLILPRKDTPLSEVRLHLVAVCLS